MDDNARLVDAARRGDAGTVKELLGKEGVDVNATHGFFTALGAAVVRRHKDIVEALLAAPGIEVNQVTEDGDTALHLACRGVRKQRGITRRSSLSNEIVTILLNAPGINKDLANDDGETPLHLAIKNDYLKISENLIKAHVDVNHADEEGYTPLHLAAMNKREAFVKLLLENGAKESVNVADRDGNTPLHLAINRDNLKNCEKLIINGSEVNRPNSEGLTPLHLAAISGNKAIVELLLNNGAEVHPSTPEGSTALSLAAHHGHQDLIAVLIEANNNNMTSSFDPDNNSHKPRLR